MSDTISTRRAREIAISFDPEKYGRSRANTGTILRKAAERGAIVAHRDPVDGWQFDERSLRQWLDNESAHKPGPKSNEKPWIYDFVMAEVDSGRPTKIHSVLASIADDGTLEGGVCFCGSQPSGDTYIIRFQPSDANGQSNVKAKVDQLLFCVRYLPSIGF